ncbi:transcriptional regulator [Rhodococcus sp. 06-621-2]|nr:helix-turn-helix domain-containing protein [Rhodococcus sp. 06-621-2]OZC59819.1 transcriptional regulator [Rhodococcus sp. 06-621-2]
MKSYGEFCALSRSLDVIGDRWTLLIVRELLIGPSRYSDLQRSLPGIATNLLAQRLRSLEESGVVTSREELAPVSARVYSLTEWGRRLQRPLIEIARWGAPLMAAPAAADEHSRGRWLVFAIMALYPDADELADNPSLPHVCARVDADGDSLLLVTDGTGLHVTVTNPNTVAEVIIEGTSDEVFRTLSAERTHLPRARVTGDEQAVTRLTAFTALAHTSGLQLSVSSLDGEFP